MRRRLSKPVVTDRWQRQEAAAWELLYAVRELFREKFAELEAIGNELHYEMECGHHEGLDRGTLPEDVQKHVWEWTAKHGISCNAVDYTATRFTAGEDGVLEGRLTSVFDANGDPVNTTPSIHANPFDETLHEFLARAREHYNEVCALFQKLGYKKGPSKRERDHFLYLAAHLVGGYSWAQIADGDTPFPLPTKGANTVAEGAREAALLIGLRMPNKSGPRKGSHPRRARDRVRRSRGR